MRSVSPVWVTSCGVKDMRTSATGAQALTISDSGAVTDRSTLESLHTVFMDSESLPTGTGIPSAGHSSMPTACTVSNNCASSYLCSQAAIQLADSARSASLMMRAAAILV